MRATHEVEVDLSGLLRGDRETRWKSHEIAVKNRIPTRNEVCEVEGWNPVARGETFDLPAVPRPAPSTWSR